MSKKVYPWKKRLKPLSHRGHKEGRKRRLLAAEEHIARRVYDDLWAASPHPHIVNPCHGLDPKKVIDGKAGREAYLITARELLKSRVARYCCPRSWFQVLYITKPHELIPLLRQCTTPEDGHIDWPKFVRYIAGLYYIAMIDPDWLLAKIPLKPSRNAEDLLQYNAIDVLSFYLLRPKSIRREEKYTIGELEPEKTCPSSIFAMVDTKLKHIIQSLKDDGDRAHWKPNTRDWKPARTAKEANLLRLYGGNPVMKLERDALNELRDAGKLNQASLQPGQPSKQRKRILDAKALEAKWDEAREKSFKVREWLEDYDAKLWSGVYDGTPEMKEKALKKSRRLERWLRALGGREKRLGRLLQRKERAIANGHINFFHYFEKLKDMNAQSVEKIVRENSFLLRYLPTIQDLILHNFLAGASGKSLPNAPWCFEYGTLALLPHRSNSLYVPYLLGAFHSGRETVLYINEKLTLKEFSERFREKIRYELSAHGVIRSFALASHKRAGEFSYVMSQEQADGFIELLGFADTREVEKLGEEYFNKSRELYKTLGELLTLSQDEILQARAAYRSKNQPSGRVVFWEPPKAEEEEEAC